MPSISYNFIRCLNTFTFQISLQVRAGEEIQLRCESQGGNPAPILKWYIDNQELDGSIQKNETSIENERRWNAYSLIKIAFQKVTQIGVYKFQFICFPHLFSHINLKIQILLNFLSAFVKNNSVIFLKY